MNHELCGNDVASRRSSIIAFAALLCAVLIVVLHPCVCAKLSIDSE